MNLLVLDLPNMIPEMSAMDLFTIDLKIIPKVSSLRH